MKDCERAIYNLSVRRPQHLQCKTYRKKEERKTVKDKKGTIRAKKSIGPALEARQSHTIKCRVSKIVPHDTGK